MPHQRKGRRKGTQLSPFPSLGFWMLSPSCQGAYEGDGERGKEMKAKTHIPLLGAGKPLLLRTLEATVRKKITQVKTINHINIVIYMCVHIYTYICRYTYIHAYPLYVCVCVSDLRLYPSCNLTGYRLSGAPGWQEENPRAQLSHRHQALSLRAFSIVRSHMVIQSSLAGDCSVRGLNPNIGL